MTPIGDTASKTMEAFLDGIQRRIEVRSHNVANSSTPNFLARQVQFEDVLAQALDRGSDPRTATPAVTRAANLPNGQGNTVDVAGDLVGLVKDNLAYDTAVNVFNHKAGLLRLALRSNA